jgi:hypothetical protein
MRIYMSARLSEAEKTEPPFFESRGDCPEDVLIQYYRHGGLNDELCGFFWTAWHAVMRDAYLDHDIETFQNGTSLACQLQPPPDMAALTDFLPKQADKYAWGSVRDYPLQQAILKLFLKWGVIPEGDYFWRSTFRGYLGAIDLQDEPQPSLISAYNGIGLLNPEDYRLLLAHVIRQHNDHVNRQFHAIVEDQSYRFDNSDVAAELPQDALPEGLVNYLITEPTSSVKTPAHEKMCTITRDLVKNLPKKRPHVHAPPLLYCSKPTPNPRRDATRREAALPC